jgi:hypothetical protein
LSTREHNETEGDLANEEAARALLESKWSTKIIKLRPEVYGVDWAFIRKERLHSWGEYKRRIGDSTKYETWKISLGKWMRMRYLAQHSLVPFAFYLEWDDGLYYCSWPHLTGMTYIQTTMVNSRGQEGDLEPAMAIPRTEFKKL